MSARVQLPKDARVAIGVPSNGTWRDQFGWNLAGMLLHTKQACPPLPLQFLGGSSSSIPHNRKCLVGDAVAGKFTHLLFLDSDMTFPTDTLLRLLAHDRDCVGAIYATRGWPPSLTAWDSESAPKQEPMQISAGETGLRRIVQMGLGCCLLNLSIFEKIDPPAFEMKWDPERETIEGEDWHFFKALESAGIGAWADMALSWEVGHIGAARFHLQQITGMANG